jgi:phospholipase/lecithinase/hemolysin
MTAASLRRRWCGILSAVAVFGFGAATANAAPVFTQMVVFGDSLSDTGNTRSQVPLGSFAPVANVAGYGANGRFSNGPVWHEYLAPELGLVTPTASRVSGANNTNFAYGGARIDSDGGPSSGLLTQYAQYNARVAGVADPGALYVVWGGGNDMRDLASAADPFAALQTSLLSLQTMFLDLIDMGATTFLVPNLPDLGKIPENRGGANEATASFVTGVWNTSLLGMLDGMSGLASFYFLDVFSIFNDVLDNPADYGFVNTTGRCRSVVILIEISCANANTWAFWDAIHPTTAAHQVLGFAAADLLINGSPLGTVPEPSVLLLLALALALMVVVQRRRGQPSQLRALS